MHYLKNVKEEGKHASLVQIRTQEEIIEWCS